MSINTNTSDVNPNLGNSPNSYKNGTKPGQNGVGSPTNGAGQAVHGVPSTHPINGHSPNGHVVSNGNVPNNVSSTKQQPNSDLPEWKWGFVYLDPDTFEIVGDSDTGYPDDIDVIPVPHTVWEHYADLLDPGNTAKQQPNSKVRPEGLRASQMLSGQNVSVSLVRKFNLGDYESIDVGYHLGGQLPDAVDPLWALDDLTDELRERIESGVGPEIAQREAIAKESFLTTPRNQQQRIVQLHLQEMGVDVDALRELLQMKINLRELANERKAVASVNGNKNGKVPA